MASKNQKNDNQQDFSLEEKLRQRTYYEKYYEDLAAHAAKMEEMGHHGQAELDRQEMAHTSQILGELTAESLDYEKSQAQTANTDQTPQEAHPESGVELSENEQNSEKQDKGITPTQEERPNRSEVQDEGLIPVDKSHFTEEALKAEARADQQLAVEEAEMDERIKKAQVTIEEQEQASQSSSPMNSSETAPESGSKNSQENEQNSPSEEEDYHYGYGM